MKSRYKTGIEEIDRSPSIAEDGAHDPHLYIDAAGCRLWRISFQGELNERCNLADSLSL